MSRNISDKQKRHSILFRRPVFCVIFLIGLSLAIYISGQQFLGSMLGLSHWIQPRGPFPDVSKLDTASIIEATKIVLRFFIHGGSLYDPNISSTSWPSFFISWGLIFLSSSFCLLSSLFGRGRIVAPSIFVGSLLIAGMALFYLVAALFMGHGSSDTLPLLFPFAIAYIAVGVYGIFVAVKEVRYVRRGSDAANSAPPLVLAVITR